MKNEKLRQSIFSKRIFMKEFISPWLIFFACCLFILPVIFIACEYNNKPGIIYDPSMIIDTSGKPTITSVVPSKVIAGVREIQIVGTGLGVKNGDTDWVYFGGVRTIIKDVQNSYITIYRPNLSSDHYGKPISVSVTNPKMLTESSSTTAKDSIIVESPGEIVGDYSAARSNLMAVDFDKQENLYVAAGRTAYRNNYAGVLLTSMVTNLPSKFNPIVAAKFGPGSPGMNLYIIAGGDSIYSLRVDIVNSSYQGVAKLPNLVNTLDFDKNGNIYAAGSKGIYLVNLTDHSVTAISGYTASASIREIRICYFNNKDYIYIADSLNIWRCQITGNGTSLGASEPLVTNVNINSGLNNCYISSFTIDEFGNIYLCLRNYPKYSLFVREANGSVTPFYMDQNILPNTVEKLIWGNSRYLYLVSSSLHSPGSTLSDAPGRFYRMAMNRNGAPYQGRKFLN